MAEPIINEAPNMLKPSGLFPSKVMSKKYAKAASKY